MQAVWKQTGGTCGRSEKKLGQMIEKNTDSSEKKGQNADFEQEKSFYCEKC